MTVHNGQGNYSSRLGIILQPYRDYTLSIITQNSVGVSISGPFRISKSTIVLVYKYLPRNDRHNALFTHYPLFTGTHGVQDLIVTVNAQQVCIVCLLAEWANTNSCQVTIYSEMTQIFKSITIMSSSTTALMNCTENIPPGYYHIIAYDTDNVSNPAVKMYRYLNTTLPQGRVILCVLLFLTL